MDIAILKTNGMPVRLTEQMFPEAQRRFDVDGFLLEFVQVITINEKRLEILYKFFQDADFRIQDREKYQDSLDGYFSEELFLKYIAEIDGITFSNLIDFNFVPFQAIAEDEIIVNILDYGYPFNFYYKRLACKFKIENVVGSKEVKNYKKEVFLNSTLIRYQIDIPQDAQKTIEDVPHNGVPSGYFYAFNFGDIYNTLLNDDSYRSKFKRQVTLITLKISQIVYEVFPKLVSLQQLDIIDDVANSTNDNLDTLDNLSKLIFLLKKSWCFYYDPTAGSQFIHKKKPDPVLYLGDYDEVFAYFYGLSMLFDKVYFYKGKDLNTNPKVLYWLLKVLPQSSLNLLPYEFLLSLVVNFIEIDKLDQEAQQMFVRIIIAINEKYGHLDDFLDFLLTARCIDNKAVTNFEKLYKLLDDDRLERLTIVNWFVNEQTNRKYFAYAIFSMWKVSKYNWDYFPSGVPPIQDSNYLSSYWIDNAEFNSNNIIEFVKGNEVTAANNPRNKENIAVDFQSKIDEKNIDLDICLRKAEAVGGLKAPAVIKPIFKNVGKFHLYQPVTLINYQGNIDLKLPQKILFPAFLIHFVREYDELADFDALISVTIDIGIEVALFFATGGVGTIKDLKYLKYVTDIGKALRGASAADNVLVWRGLYVGSESLTYATSALINVNSYLINEENDPIKRAFQLRVQKILVWTMFGIAGFSLRANYMTVKESAEAMVIYRNSVGLGVNQDTVALLERFEGKQAVLAAEYSNKLNTINANNNGAISIIINWFQDVSLLTDAQRLKFMEHFAERFDDLKQLNNSDALRNWLELVSKEIKEASRVNVVTDNIITKGFLRYYDHNELKDVLETFTYLQKIKFFKEYANAEVGLFNKILERPNSTLEFLSSAQNRIKVSQIDKYNAEDIIIIAKSELKAIPLELATIKNNSVLQEMMNRFLKETNYELIDPDRIKSLYNGSAAEFQSMVQNLSPKQLRQFKSSNKAVITTEVRQNGSFIERIHEKYISGSEAKIRDDIFGGNIPSDLTEPSRATFDVFKKRAMDDMGGFRGEDTEMKYIANFLENHWDKGDHFIIKIESTLYACNNCKAYLLYFKDVAKKHGKILDINFVANSEVTTNGILKIKYN